MGEASLDLHADDDAEVWYVIGGLPLPAGWRSIGSVDIVGNMLTLRDDSGASQSVPFDRDFLDHL